ncbi:MAG: glycoside hydrolase family 32 protein [Lachnospiraceae bacterium]|nr:glycoside hydrolase family 32 protein [Lachnospiraceae bacterium]
MDKNISKELLAARKMEMELSESILNGERPVYHVASPLGWINDPNGFSVFQNEYHLFFQYYPYETKWGPMHWGHCKSKDLISWEYLPAAMAPDAEWDQGGCYSGSALEADGEHILIYTGVIDKKLEDGSKYYRQVQCMAKGDGLNYEKWEQNPIIAQDKLPEGSSLEDFRDPKIWKEEDGYYLIAGSRSADGSGQILMYRSDDLKSWDFVTILDSCRNEYGKMWECPDFFPLGDHHILIVSPQDMRAKGLDFHNGNNSLFLYGRYDHQTHHFEREKVTSADYGLDFYAPQTMLAPDGRRIMIGWMQSWDAKITPSSFKWAGMMTVPRELVLKDGKIYQKPVRELEQYRVNPVTYQNQMILAPTKLDGISGRVLDLELEITGSDFEQFSICFAANKEYHTELCYDRNKKTLTIDRTDCGLVRDAVCTRSMEVQPDTAGTEQLKLRILLDRYSAEIFVNDGEKTMSNAFYTPMEADQIIFDANGSACVNIRKYDIQVSR